MQKRAFLKLLAMTLIGAAAGTLNNTALAATKKRIVVIGAGLAGLAAARELQRRGHEVVVVEARDRIGGRIWTSTKWADMPLDFGATWIHGVDGNPITALADEINASRLVTQYDSVANYATNGQLLTEAQEAQLEQLRDQVDTALKQAQARDPDVSIKLALQPLMKQLLPSSEAAHFIDFIVNSSIEQEYSGSAAQLSTHWYDNDKVFDGDDVLFVQGYKVITEYLAKDLHIELAQVVKEIQWSQPKVRVTTQKTAFVADHVVITLPLGVLQSNRVRFAPALPSDKRTAIAKLGMGVLNKCYLRFEQAFWPEDVDWLEYIPAKHGEWAEWVSYMRAANKPILLGFNAADRGREIEHMSDRQIVASAMQTLRTMFGKGIPEPVDYQITRWASDPYSLGSYSFNALGSNPKMRKTLAAPLNKKLFFAGEATETEYFATAHGAFLSGVRAANDVLNA